MTTTCRLRYPNGSSHVTSHLAVRRRGELFPGMPHAFARDSGPETDRAIQLMKKAFVAQQCEDMAA